MLFMASIVLGQPEGENPADTVNNTEEVSDMDQLKAEFNAFKDSIHQIVPDITEETTVNDLLDMTNALYGALVIFLGFVAKYIPGIKNIPNVALRVLVIAIITGLIFKFTGLAGGWQMAITFIVSALGYDKIIAPVVGKSPKVGNEVSGANILTMAGLKKAS